MAKEKKDKKALKNAKKIFGIIIPLLKKSIRETLLKLSSFFK